MTELETFKSMRTGLMYEQIADTGMYHGKVFIGLIPITPEPIFVYAQVAAYDTIRIKPDGTIQGRRANNIWYDLATVSVEDKPTTPKKTVQEIVKDGQSCTPHIDDFMNNGLGISSYSTTISVRQALRAVKKDLENLHRSTK